MKTCISRGAMEVGKLGNLADHTNVAETLDGFAVLRGFLIARSATTPCTGSSAACNAASVKPTCDSPCPSRLRAATITGNFEFHPSCPA